ncbi:testis-expressed protein 36-like [Lytechinus variegatus]|uniref:testis-expressed protein 36-like n=1 Tax=Lytechinus variegatus TaxID=7654 RepID=UPI001BB1EA5A|nr:testis-expressed protein 36-like [Lytechinus variegatus]
MPKSRAHAPSTAEDGIWFQTRGWSGKGEMRNTGTTTGLMLSSKFNPESSSKPQPPPPAYNELAEKTYIHENPFSMHDNRNSFQDHGVYFGHGLGKKLEHGSKRQHNSEDFVTWKSPDRFFKTDYQAEYQGKPTKNPPTTRRFPRKYPEPDQGLIELPTSTTHTFEPPKVPYDTPTQVLVSSKEPHLKPNPWKYSYKAYVR